MLSFLPVHGAFRQPVCFLEGNRMTSVAYEKEGCLRAAIRNFHLGPCKIEKSKIAKLCHNKGLPKPFIKI